MANDPVGDGAILVEAGRTNPTIATAAAIAEALDVKLAALFTEE